MILWSRYVLGQMIESCMKTKRLGKINLQWFGSVDQGKQLELIAADSKGKEAEGYPYPLATIIADDSTEELFLELNLGEEAVQIPVEEVKKAFLAAVGEVHSEKWYEKNVYPKE